MAAEPAPPQLHPIRNMHVISVTVVNHADSKHLVPDSVRADVVKRLNLQSIGVIFTGDDGTKADGALAITILEESGQGARVNQRTGDVTWKFQVKFSAELSQSGGHLIWSRSGCEITETRTWDSPIPDGVHPGWDAEILRDDLVPGIAETLAGYLAHLR